MPVMIAVSAPQMARPSVEVVGNARGHQQAADIGVAEAERAVLVGEPRDLLRRELRHHHRDFEHHGPQPHRVLVGRDVDRAVGVAIGQKVDRGEVAGRVVEEHVLRARVRRADRAGGRRGVPVVHRGVEVQARIGRGPGGVADLFPEIARLQVLWTLPSMRRISFQSPSFSTARRKSSFSDTELLEFWPDTVR